ncbi:OST-HTH/LOTUS domain-containing protein, partial [Pseudolysinimonas sp.]|uniref:OST-HTH/LOTUS domain-containing protein n=1 Tax=Pseudolysinimonas sp. TaxID=2680009 RepID=UPI003783EEBA
IQALVAALDEFETYDAILRDEPALEPVAVPAKATGKPAAGDEAAATPELTPATATRLLVRAIGLARGKQDDDEWLNASTVKSQIKRLDPSFNEKSLGFRSFMDFVRAAEQVEIREAGQQRFMRLREEATAPAETPPAATQPVKKASRRATSTAAPRNAEPQVAEPVETKPAARAPRRAKSAPTATDPFREP